MKFFFSPAIIMRVLIHSFPYQIDVSDQFAAHFSLKISIICVISIKLQVRL